ncbi:MAG TPA: DUF3631 domain-containing protein, partial [Candidatus Angelobacter sp.]
QFIGRYLQCSEHQRTVLALWVLHTHCSTAAQVTPYLAIQSAQKQSGKTLCLKLLSLLCDFPALTAGFTANALTRRIDGLISTVLLDECQATFGTRSRSKGPALRAILASGYHCGLGYTDATHERNAFCPKAFAGMGQIPEALADRSISIILEPLEAPSTVKARVQRFDLRRAVREAKPLQEQLRDWAEDNLPYLEEKPVYSEEDFPPNLSSRRRDMSEPLLQLADFIGGLWPTRIREALDSIFESETAFELRQSRQLLADIRDCFAHSGYPERLSTAALLDWMHPLPTRPWDVEGPITARTFARLLLAFDIHPRVQRIGSANPSRGYQLQDFIEPWQIHLGFTAPDGDSRSGFVSSVEPMTQACPRGELAQPKEPDDPGSPVRPVLTCWGGGDPGSPVRSVLACWGGGDPGSPVRPVLACWGGGDPIFQVSSDSVISHLCPLPSLRSDSISSGGPSSPVLSDSIPCPLFPAPWSNVTDRSHLEIAAKDAVCNPVTDSGAISNPSVVHTWNSNGDRRMASV